MSPELRERLIALLEDESVGTEVTSDSYGQIDGQVCASCGADALWQGPGNGYKVEHHEPDCELAACLQELRAEHMREMTSFTLPASCRIPEDT